MGFGCDTCIGCQPSGTTPKKKTEELCIKLEEVKPVFRSEVKAMDKNGDGKVCQSEVPEKNKEEFENFVNSVKINLVINFGGENILKSELDCLQKFAKTNGIKLEGKLFKCKNGGVAALVSSGTKISDISALKGLTNLQTLDLLETKVGDISALKGLTNLQELGLPGSKVRDLSALKGLTKLQTLDLEWTNVSDLSPLKGLTNLRWLNLLDTKVSDISALKELTKLQTLSLIWTKVSDISALKELTNLQELYLRGSNVSDVSALKGLTKLKELDLVGSNVSDISALKGLTKLQTLSLWETNVSREQIQALQSNLPGLKIEQ